ncbi:MAG: hypoxanthine phosphoribosyltransferase [Acidobacteria bacterium]|nr:hypoxanthine phosphoribosyltransferase [Acidobacteriota bacterium]MCI0625425.1 hypoxanthine phosphoribosyltransferase [Acidobacteriota bacterium]MCI0717539.1 hypoxanthine phosphoribosyltransferase [Acidobacteriota bacterium]
MLFTNPAAQLKVLIDDRELQQRVKELGEEISRDYQGKNLHLICILKGACVFLADLIRHLPLDISIDFMAVSSYANSLHTSGEVKIIKDLDSIIQGRDVLIIEDILDTGLTLDYLTRSLRTRSPHSLNICALLSKPSRRIKEVNAAYVGFEIPDEFVVGYGLDFAERYRNLPSISVMKKDE